MTRFANRTPLPGISLTAGEYERMGMEVDSVLYEVYYFRGHDFFSEPLAILRDTMESFIRDKSYDYLQGWAKEYPFEKLALVETPATYATYLRNQKRYTEFVMPELVFFPEKGFNLGSADIPAIIEIRNQNNVSGLQDSVQMAQDALGELFYDLFGYWEAAKNKAVLRSTEPMLVQHTIFVQSDEYPAIDILLQKMQYIWTGFAEVHDDDVDYNLLANIYLQKHSLRDAIADPDIDLQTLHTLIRLKSDELKQLIRLWIPYGDYLKFIEDFFQEHAFETVPFSVFCNGLRETGCTDIDSLFAQWYNGYGTPAIIIRETMPRLIMGQETEMYSMGFKAYNISDKNALLSISVTTQNDGRTRDCILPAGKAWEFKYVLKGKPFIMHIGTHISQNIPSEYNFYYTSYSRFPETHNAMEGIFVIDTTDFLPAPGEPCAGRNHRRQRGQRL